MGGENQCENARVITTHGKRKNQGKLAIVNDQLALCYTEGQDEQVVAYTPLSEIIKISCRVLPRYQLDF
ncbi:MAG: hypothetical protein BI182_12275 [Acetobacterium sp. MES1]|uniref:hypothetical protein n=1 Tax=Acetobacterium sp. MES1 TaxID=1899015 RepID=UPI000B9D33EE|nr:hypothetical protein [Acetobacterium sp. MES1]OXS26900.1 MAG: hypothetical protein BI182_12275 [Acetobacterium sp. MES1]